MPKTPDRFPGAREEDELKLEPSSANPTVVGAMRSVSGRFKFRDDVGVFDPRSGIGFDVNDILTDDVTLAVLVDDATKNVLVDA